MAKGNSTIKLTVHSSEGDECELSVDFDWWHDAGVWTLPNGDPGYPEDGGTKVTGFCMAENPTEEVPSWVTNDMVQEALDEADVSYGDFSDDFPEPDFRD
jgi:hypothetical protein